MLTKFLVAATVLVSTYAQTVVDIVSGESDLSILTTQLTDNGLVSVLSGDGPFTVLAPTDTAFGLITLPSDAAVVTEILKYHVINANVASTDLTSGLVATTLEAAGQTVTAYLNNNMAYFYDSKGNLAQVTTADLVATNGVVHKIDAVLIPDGTIDDITGNVADLSSLDGALAANGLDTTLQGSGPFTLFAPSNAAVSAFNGGITSGVLTYHVVATKYLAADVPTTATALTTVQGATITVIRDESTGAVTITDAAGMVATVTIANIAGTNGVVHIVDTVLEYRDVVGLASDRSDLSTLVSALNTANLVTTLQEDGPYTVLAPTDTAFGLITIPTDTAVLTQVLLYHVLGSAVYASDLSSGLVATTLQADSQTVTAQLTGGASFYDSNGRIAMVTVADIVGSNGVIHVIDAVLLPDGTVDDITGNVADLSSLDGALAANGLDATLADTASEFTLFAPSNTAIAAVSGVDITSEILTYHVIATKYLSTAVPTTATDLTTVQGETLSVIRDEATGGVTVTDANGNTATVTVANIAGKNGVVHIIDSVILPFVSSEPTMMPTMSPTEDTSGAFAHSAIISLIVGAFAALV